MDTPSFPANIKKAPITISRSALSKAEESGHKYNCVACDGGMLLGTRNEKTMELLDFDHCVLCGQLYLFTKGEQK